MNDTTLGIIAAAVPLVIIGFFAFRRMPWILAFFVALVAVGIGYLQTTGAIKEFGHKVRVSLPAGILPEHKKPQESTPPEGGAMKALPPPAEPAAPEPTPTPPPAAETAPTPPATPAPPAAESTPAPAEPAPAAPAPAAPETPPATPQPAPANP